MCIFSATPARQDQAARALLLTDDSRRTARKEAMAVQAEAHDLHRRHTELASPAVAPQPRQAENGTYPVTVLGEVHHVRAMDDARPLLTAATSAADAAVATEQAAQAEAAAVAQRVQELQARLSQLQAEKAALQSQMSSLERVAAGAGTARHMPAEQGQAVADLVHRAKWFNSCAALLQGFTQAPAQA